MMRGMARVGLRVMPLALSGALCACSGLGLGWNVGGGNASNPSLGISLHKDASDDGDANKDAGSQAQVRPGPPVDDRPPSLDDEPAR